MENTSLSLDYKETVNSVDKIKIFVKEFEEKNKLYLFTKRVFDFSVSLITLLFLLPLFIIISILIFLDDPNGSPIFKQKRTGKNGKEFNFYKFRSMVVDAEDRLEELMHLNECDGKAFKIKGDPRITKIGKFIRRTSIDELPQLYNVLIGDMSIVGPRPPLPIEVEKYNDYEMQRLAVKPGLTCIWQTMPKRNKISFENWIKLDIEYIHNRCWNLDIKLIFRTVKVMATCQGE